MYESQTNGDEGQSEEDESDSGVLGETDHVREAVIKKAWDQAHGSERHDTLLLGSPSTQIDLSNLHPNTGRIFKLWHIYLENLSPLLKITHTPTLQPHIIDVASDVTTISPVMGALMFAIYSISVQSLND